MADPPLPPYAYVPGQNARHPEGAFDAIKSSVSDDVPLRNLHQTEAFKTGLRYLHAGYYWECHEVLEAVWMHAPPGTAEREMTQALIQLANARLKIKMGKPRAVRRLLGRVEAHLAQCPAECDVLGLRVEQIARWASELT